MTKIFISHASIDGHFAEKLMDLFQTQFSLTRENFFFTSDEELAIGENWIEQIREGMDQSSLILPIITPNFLASQFCLCELGATWVKKTSLFPIIVPPLKHNALDSTPFRSWMQSIILNSETDLQRIAEAMKNKGIGDFNSVRFTKRAKAFIETRKLID